MIHRSCLILAILLLLTVPAKAQDATRIERNAAPAKQVSASPEVLHITDRLNRTPEARQALEDFHQKREASQLNSFKSAQSNSNQQYQLGARVTFRVLKNVATNPSWEERDFVLKANSDIAAIWVDQNQLDLNNVTDNDVAALEEALLHSTPAGSVAPNQGIIANNNTYFGSPPNVDGDGRVDILLYDIVEGQDNSNSFVAGFVTTQDLSSSGGGNNKDILYLDTNPGIKSRPISSALATAAHEYQHLIHFNYDRFELTFTNEGLSEWSEVLNGYPARTMSFLRDPATYNVRLLGWDEGLDDYSRAGLFTGYLAERAPADAVASLARNTARGRTGYEQMLDAEGLDFNALLMDYHTANFLNSPEIDPWFVYSHPQYASVQAVATVEVDGRASQSTPQTTEFIEAGSVEYLVWKKVSDFSFSIDAIEPFASIRDRIQIRVLLRGEDGASRFEDLELPQEGAFFPGSFDEVILTIVHVQPELTSRVGVTYDASWSNSTQGTIADVVYDNGQVASETYFSLSAGANGAVATRFELPSPGQTRLLEVEVAPFYLNQFSSSNLPSTAPRDLTLTIWAEDANGEPANVLFAHEVTDPRAFTSATQSLNHFSIDLEPFSNELSGLPNVLYIGYTEAGSDENYMVVGPSSYSTEDVSFVTRQNGNWGALWETQFSDSGENEFPLSGTVIPVRAIFEVGSQPVSTEDETSIPTVASLEQNYPNPFRGSTTIAYTIAQPEEVTLAIYDMLGRQVRTLVEHPHEAGQHTVSFDASSLPSGTYFYTLQTGPQSTTRRMTVVR